MDPDGGVPTHCTKCKKFVLDGRGNQEETPDGDILRFCNQCWSRRCDQICRVQVKETSP
jgi:hypothetical protein